MCGHAYHSSCVIKSTSCMVCEKSNVLREESSVKKAKAAVKETGEDEDDTVAAMIKVQTP